MPRIPARYVEINVIETLKFYLANPQKLLSQLEKEKEDYSNLEKKLASLDRRMKMEQVRIDRFYDLYGDKKFDKENLLAKIDDCKLKISSIKESRDELSDRLDLLRDKSAELKVLKENIKNLRAEAVKRVYKEFDRMNNKSKRELLRVTIEGRLAIDKEKKFHGELNLNKAYEWLFAHQLS